ncbi:MAG TPA: acylphosphatase [Mycobacteriales bacterium]|nr:acylphosphatase [Mycobacteriales bacterium]
MTDSPGGSTDAGRGPVDVEHVRLTAWVRGQVQGVGFRWWTRARALELGLVGSATNLDDGRVEVVVEGPQSACSDLLARLRGAGCPGRVDLVTERWDSARGGTSGFVER